MCPPTTWQDGCELQVKSIVVQWSSQNMLIFRFCVLVAGFVSRTQNHKKLFEEMLQSSAAVEIPTLHVIGDTDRFAAD